MKRDIIYDWDGTLCDSIPASFEATCRIFDACGVARPSLPEYICEFCPPFFPFYHARGVAWSEDEIWDYYLKIAGHHDSLLFPDVKEELGRQRRKGYRISLVTCQRKGIIDGLLERHGCGSLFDHMLCDVTPDKVDAFKEACARMGSRPCEVYAVGDLAFDMIQAIRAGVMPIGIDRRATGRYGTYCSARAPGVSCDAWASSI